jgi:hypothetical protein
MAGFQTQWPGLERRVAGFHHARTASILLTPAGMPTVSAISREPLDAALAKQPMNP